MTRTLARSSQLVAVSMSAPIQLVWRRASALARTVSIGTNWPRFSRIGRGMRLVQTILPIRRTKSSNVGNRLLRRMWTSDLRILSEIEKCSAFLVRLSRFGVLVVIAMAALSTRPTNAVTITWDGGGNFDWFNGFNWTPGLVPDDGDDAVIGHSLRDPALNFVFLTADAISSPVDKVTLLPRTRVILRTEGFQMKIDDNDEGLLEIGSTTRVIVAPVASDPTLVGLDVDRIHIGQGGTFSNIGRTVVDNQLFVASDGAVNSTGLIELGGNPLVPTSLVNNGTISPGLPIGTGELTLRAAPGTRFDLDGDDDQGNINVAGDNLAGVGAAKLIVDGSLTDSFSGAMEVGRRDTIEFTKPWSLDGELHLRGGDGDDLATLSGGEVTVSGGRIRVESGAATIAAPLTVNDGSLGMGLKTTLDFDAPATFGPSSKFLVHNDVTINVNQDVQFSQPTVLLSGVSRATNVINVAAGGTLRIDSDHAVLRPLDYNATMNLASDSTLTLNGNFSFGSTATFNTSSAGVTLNFGGFTRISTDTDLEGSGPFNTVNVTRPDATLIIEGAIANNAENVFHGSFINHGTLSIDVPGESWTLGNGGSLQIVNEGGAPTVQGDSIKSQGVISGDGRLTADVVNQLNSRIAPGEETQSGRLEWQDASLTLQPASTIEFDLGGTVAGETFDQIVAQTLAIEGGDLVVNLISNFVPGPTDVFAVVEADRVSGQLDNVANGERLLIDGVGSFLVSYGSESAFGANGIVLSNFDALIASLLGDFNDNRILDAADIDLLSASVGSSDATFDLTSDGFVDSADRQFWVEDLSNTCFGDTNLDGEFNSRDFIEVFAKGEYEDDVLGNSGWADGDWNGNGDFESGDLILAFQSGGYQGSATAARGVAAVPEPSAPWLVLLGIVGLVRTERRR